MRQAGWIITFFILSIILGFTASAVFGQGTGATGASFRISRPGETQLSVVRDTVLAVLTDSGYVTDATTSTINAKTDSNRVGIDSINSNVSITQAGIDSLQVAIDSSGKFYDFSLSDSTVSLFRGINGSWAEAGEDLSFGNIVYLDTDSTWKKSDADTVGNQYKKPGQGFVTADISSGSTGTIMFEGTAFASGWGLDSIGKYLYVSATAGEMTDAPDTSAGHVVQIIGQVIHPSLAIFKFPWPWVRK